MKKKLFALIMAACMTMCCCACGETEEEVEITTVPEATEENADEAEDISIYQEIYKEYDAKIKEAAAGYVKELKEEAKDLSKDELYDKVKEKADALGKIREEGEKKMSDAMLASTEDDQETYEKWYSKLTEAFTDYSREVTAVYTDNF